jgi:hypothetical protein
MIGRKGPPKDPRRIAPAGEWWRGTDLNRRHRDFQSPALPTELPRRKGENGGDEVRTRDLLRDRQAF